MKGRGNYEYGKVCGAVLFSDCFITVVCRCFSGSLFLLFRKRLCGFV